MALVLTLDGTDLSTKGMWATGVPADWLSPPRLGRASHRIPGSPRGYLSSVPEIPARRMRVPLRVFDSAFSLTTIRANEEWLKTKLGEEIPLQVAAAGISTRVIRGRLDEVRLVPRATWETPAVDLEIELTCEDGTWKATSDTTETINGTPNALALGSAPVSDWVLTITATTNSITDITITLGTHTLTWLGTIAASKALVIDAGACTVKNDGVNAIGTYAGGFPLLRPTASPSVSAVKASGSGTLGGSLVYQQAFW